MVLNTISLGFDPMGWIITFMSCLLPLYKRYLSQGNALTYLIVKASSKIVEGLCQLVISDPFCVFLYMSSQCFLFRSVISY